MGRLKYEQKASMTAFQSSTPRVTDMNVVICYVQVDQDPRLNPATVTSATRGPCHPSPLDLSVP